MDNIIRFPLALFFKRLTSVWTTFCWGVELALYGAFGGTSAGRTWKDPPALWMRVDEGFGLVIPTWPPEAEARLAGIGAEGGDGRRRWSRSKGVSAETRIRQGCIVSTVLLYV